MFMKDINNKEKKKYSNNNKMLKTAAEDPKQ